MHKAKPHFVTGLIILLPIALTLAIVAFVFNLLTVPFVGIVKTVLDYYGLVEHGWQFFSADQLQTLIAQLLILVGLFALTIGLGMVARWFFFRTFIGFAEYCVKHIPLISPIYKTCKEVIRTIFTTEGRSFKQVVIVRFPHPETYAIGLVTCENITALKAEDGSDTVAVFVPTTPNPTSGFLIMYRRQDLVYLDMSVEEAFKYVVSCGIIKPSFTAMEPSSVPIHLTEHPVVS